MSCIKRLALLAAALAAACGLTNPVDPSQPPCGGGPVYYGEYCCQVNQQEWRCPLEAACGEGPGDCRTLEGSDP